MPPYVEEDPEREPELEELLWLELDLEQQVLDGLDGLELEREQDLDGLELEHVVVQ